jgi:uncharacterized membrane protein
MKKSLRFAGRAVLSGFLIIVPIYLAVLLLLKGMQSVAGLVQPLTSLLPDWLPAERLLSLLLVLMVCFLIGVAASTGTGRAIRDRIERKFLERIPGYTVMRSLTQQLAGDSRDNAWKPALAEIEDALVPAFIIEEFEDGRYTVFVPSVPTPLAGAVYILERNRVHPLDVPFTQALQVVTRWGSGAKNLQLAMERGAAHLPEALVLFLLRRSARAPQCSLEPEHGSAACFDRGIDGITRLRLPSASLLTPPRRQDGV